MTVIALVYVFVVAYAMSWAVVDWIIAFSTPLFLSRFSSGLYFLFGACTFITVIVCILFQPESKGVSLEGLDKIFEVSPWRKFFGRIAPRMHGRGFGAGGGGSGGARDEYLEMVHYYHTRQK